MEKLIEINNIAKSYGQEQSLVKALDDVSLDIFSGEFLVILGSSGSGKSTLLNVISGIDTVEKGSIIVNNVDITKLNDNELTEYRANEIGYIFQFFNLLNELTVKANITLAPGSNKDLDKINTLLEKLGLKDKINRYPNELSGGEQQRVSIARAMNKKANIILCDEPTGALDYASGKEVLEILESINKNEKKTIVLVTHTKEIAKMADRVIEMRSGKIINEYKNENKLTAKEIDW